MKPRVILAGGSGFLGTRLAEDLARRGYEPLVLTRSTRLHTGLVRQRHWDGRTVADWAEELNHAFAMINLAGRSVNCRYTSTNRREIQQSRIEPTLALGQALQRCSHPPKVWVQASSLAIYGDAGDHWCDETTEPGEGFPVETCLRWEEAFNSVATPRTRRVVLRIGFALDQGCGALKTLEGLVRWFLGGSAGSGRQYISWIHWRDLNAMLRWAIERDDIEGTFNATSPAPVSNAQFMREMRLCLHRPWSPPAPDWLAYFGAWLMRTEASLALAGRRCAPSRFLEKGFKFEFPELRPALGDIYR
ncbi:MAG TPA: TIGR01777 family oxidoreductase [Candidatus Binatia bacterium]|jgi:uncharacterized protein (TIGR01777 family)|nr:TIGR01777 family oxidoreductase [Candidatus Binatia bacterium]